MSQRKQRQRLAVRETEEETGIRVELLGLVGLYARPEWIDDHCAVFAARHVGGNLRSQEGEAINVGYFAVDALPERLVWWHRQPIADALTGRGGSAVWHQDVRWPFGDEFTFQQFIKLRAQDQLTPELRAMTWQAFCRQPEEEEQRREVP